MILRLALFPLLLLLFNAAFATSNPPSSRTGDSYDEQARQLEKLLQQAKERIESIEDPALKEEFRKRLSELETPKVFVSPSSRFTPEMAGYFARYTEKLEDCGTRHFPKQGRKPQYGRGMIAVTLDRDGKVLETEILKSSRKTLVDAHIRKVVRASSPFGAPPDKITVDQDYLHSAVVIVTSFDFRSDSDSVPLLKDEEACKWHY